MSTPCRVATHQILLRSTAHLIACSFLEPAQDLPVRDQEVYRKAVAFAADIAELRESFPRGYFLLTDQLHRAALSIAANLAEGSGRFTKPDRKNSLMIARGSVQECVPLLEVARR